MSAKTTAGEPCEIKVIILEDDAFLADAMGRRLDSQEDVSVVGWRRDIEGFFALLDQEGADVAIVDLHLDRDVKNGIAAVARIRDAYPSVRCLVRTAFPGPANFLATYYAGVKAFISKEADDSLVPPLHELVRIVARGGRYYDPEIIEKLVSLIDPNRLQAPVQTDVAHRVNLTRRQRQVLRLLVEELSYKLDSGENGFWGPFCPFSRL